MRKKTFLFAALPLIGISLLLGGCAATTQEQSTANTSSSSVSAENTDFFSLAEAGQANDGFLGDKGFEVKAQNNKIFVAESSVNDGNMHSFTFFSEKANKNIYFFIVKASDGTYRAAANACEVCYSSKKGFKQVGDLIRCENCRVTYPKDKIALEKGGCNPGPIDKDVAVEDGQLVIEVQDVEDVAYLFS